MSSHMHEFSLCQNIANIVIDNAQKENRLVKEIVLKIGELAGVDVESLSFWFPVAVKDTDIKDAKLRLEYQKGEAQCNNCSEIYGLSQLYQSCPKCESYDKKILKGQELLVESIIYK